MALTGLQIYKLLSQTNCKECGFPTCLAFAMKLAAKQTELAKCPYVTEASKAQLEAAAAPPIRLVTIAAEGGKVEVGNETVLFRHEKTFYHRPGIFVRLKSSAPTETLTATVAAADTYATDYVGLKLGIDGFAVEANGAADSFAAAVTAVRAASRKPLILIATDSETMAAGIKAAGAGQPLLYAADAQNWQKMAELAKLAQAPLAVKGESLEALASLAEDLKKAGVADLVLQPPARHCSALLTTLTQIRRLALKKNFRPLGYPTIVFPAEISGADETLAAAQCIAKYASLIVLDTFEPADIYPLLVLRQNIYTDPQKPIQVQPGLYEINSPSAEAPAMVTTNFSITYFAVNNEVEGSGWPAWLIVADAEGMSVLTAWAAGKFDADRIAKSVKAFNLETHIGHKRLVIPGHVAVLSGELEEALPGWEIMVGPREAVDIPAYLKAVWQK